MITPNSRNTDPLSSYLAGDDIEASGKAAKQRQIAFRAVTDNPGLTSQELAGKCSLDRYQLARRLPEMYKIVKGDPRICSVSGRLAVTWYVQEK